MFIVAHTLRDFSLKTTAPATLIFPFPVPQVGVFHDKDGLVIRHIADDTKHVDKPSQFAGPLAAVSGDDLISAALMGPY